MSALPRDYPAFGKGGGDIYYPLVLRTSELQGEIPLGKDEPAVDEDVDLLQDLIGKRSAAAHLLIVHLFKGKAREHPDILKGISLPNMLYQGEDPFLILRLERFSAKDREPSYVRGLKHGYYLVLDLFREFLAVGEGPGLRLETALTGIPASGDE